MRSSRNRRNRHQGSQLPEINLVPMMDVLMTILTFFIIISMTLTGQQFLSIDLPESKVGESPKAAEAPKEKLIVGLTDKGQAVVNKQNVSQDALAKQVADFLEKNPDGVVMLKADRRLNFKNVAELLKTLRDIGGDRVLLGIDQKSS
jgi:biopolymer transport protein ExbD